MTPQVTSLLVSLSILAAVSAFMPAATQYKASVALNAEAEQSRKAFLSVAAASVLGRPLGLALGRRIFAPARDAARRVGEWPLGPGRG